MHLCDYHRGSLVALLNTPTRFVVSCAVWLCPNVCESEPLTLQSGVTGLHVRTCTKHRDVLQDGFDASTRKRIRDVERERLRDRFAAAALQGLLCTKEPPGGPTWAAAAYELADQMLRERDSVPE